MHSYQLIEIAGLLTAHARLLVCEQPVLAEQALINYWTAARCQLDCWGLDLRTYSLALAHGNRCSFVPRLHPLALEIEASHTLARTMAAVGATHDAIHRRHESGPLTQNILTGVEQAAGQLDSLLQAAHFIGCPHIAQFQAIRYQLRLLTDDLLGCFLPLGPAEPFAHDLERARQQAYLALLQLEQGQEPVSWSSIKKRLAGLRDCYNRPGPNTLGNQQVAAAVMELFPPESFDDQRTLHHTWLRRIDQLSHQATSLVNGCLHHLILPLRHAHFPRLG